MKLKVFSHKEKDETVRLALEQMGDEVVLRVVDADGVIKAQGNILAVTKDGCIRMCAAVDEDFGFKMETFGKVKVV